jgi:CBS domain-containing protein
VPEAFAFSHPPFDRLTDAERDRVRASVDLACFPKGATVLAAGETPRHLHVMVKGTVQEIQGSEVLAAFGTGDCFDIRGLLTDSVDGGDFIAREDAICHLLPHEVVLDLIRTNPEFGIWCHRATAERLREKATHQANRDMASFMMARIRQAFIHPPAFVDADCSARDAVAAMKDNKATSLLVRDGDRVGIVSDRDLRDHVILEGAPVTTPVRPLATYDMITLDIDDFLFNALIVMTKHNIRRVVITDDGKFVGILEQMDLLGFLSNNSHLVALRVERATDIADLQQASGELSGLIQALHASGVKAPQIAEMVTALNRRIFRKLFELLAPSDLVENSCLIVMGSEGRGEQILRTDQDNGLILRDGYGCPDLDGIVGRFSRTLIEFGYPECPGRIMVNNPDWSRPLAGYKDAIYDWIHRPNEETQLNLAIFFDAETVAGDAALLKEAKLYLQDQMSSNAAFFSHFAKPTLSFDTPIGFFSHLRGEQLDIKKGGIFPLVHGIRSLALEKRLPENNTFERIQGLLALNVIDRAFADELSEALALMLELRLKLKLAAGQSGTQTDNLIRPDDLNRVDRDQLRDALTVVKRFKEYVTYHFHLKMF